MNTITKHILNKIEALTNIEKAKWQENYVKHSTKSYGVGIPDIREIIKQTEKEYNLTKLSDKEQIAILDSLMQHPYTEPKLAAILYIQLFWGVNSPTRTLQVISNWFDQHWIFDWNTCDWLCVRILSPMVDEKQEVSIPTLTAWKNEGYLWKARAALVPFAQCKTLEKHKDLILDLSATLIQREERFSKTAVGWVLRQYSKIDEAVVLHFLNQYKNCVTKEVVKNATKYLEVRR